MFCFPSNNMNYTSERTNQLNYCDSFLRRYLSLTNNPSRKAEEAEKAEREQARLAEKMQQAVGASKRY